MTIIRAPKSADDCEVNFFFSPAGEAWRVHTRATWLPGYLRKCFDENYEMYPAYLDLEDLDDEMKSSGVTYTKRISSVGGVEITARGPAAMVLTTWLAQSVASNLRGREHDQPELGTNQTG
ncbi:MAG: hypothetical protein QM784_30230 [Polyangiaceae bacterium]